MDRRIGGRGGLKGKGMGLKGKGKGRRGEREKGKGTPHDLTEISLDQAPRARTYARTARHETISRFPRPPTSDTKTIWEAREWSHRLQHGLQIIVPLCPELVWRTESVTSEATLAIGG